MKKLSLLLLVIALVCGLFVLTSCGGNDGDTNTDSGSTNTGSQTQVDEDLEAAYEYVKQTYKTLNVTAASFEVMKKAPIGDKIFNISWSTNNDAITITESEDGTSYVVNVPDLGDTAVNYTLKFSIENENGEKKMGSFNLTVPVFSLNTHDQYVAAADGEKLIVQGIVTGIMAKTHNTSTKEESLYLQDLNGNGGYYVYNANTDLTDIKVGMTVEVRGEKKNYNGTFELVKADVIVLDETIKTVTPVDFTEAVLGAASLDDKALTSLNGMLVTIKGVTLLQYSESNGYHNFEIGNHKTYFRISTSSNCVTEADGRTLTEQFNNNFYNAADVTGIIAVYNSNMYLMPVSKDALQNIVAQEKPDDVQVDITLENTTVPGMIQLAGDTTLPTTFSSLVGVSISWELVDGSGVATLNGATLTVTIPEEAKTVKLTATVTSGEVSKTKDYEIAIKPISTITIEEANNIGDPMASNQYTDEIYYITGIVESIANDTYGNLYITDESGEFRLYIYGLYDSTGKVRYDKMDPKPLKGDTITVLSSVGKYNTDVQLKNAKVTAHTVHPDNEGATTPDNYTEMTIPEALAAEDGTKIKVTGTVSEINGAWNEQYGNMNVTIIDADGNTLYLYRLSTKVEMGDIITVKGEMATWDEERQVAQGATATIDGNGGSDSSDEIPFVAVSPVIGGEYFFAMTQDGALCYITGEMATGNAKYYMATVSTQANAAKITVLAGPTADTYYITLTVGGATKYMDLVVSGTHKNAEYVDAAPEVGFSFDATNKVFYKVLEGENYTFGTDFERKYTTVGGVKVDATLNAMLQISLATAHTHEYTDEVTAPTCTEQGYTTHTCSCGDVVVDTYVDALGHSYVEGTCTVCGATDHEHTYAEEVTAPTCTAKGYTTYTCTVPGCGHSYTGNEVAELGHSYTDGVCANGCGIEDPNYYYPISIADALTANVGKKVILTGTISEIKSAWSDKYSNMEVWLSDSEGNKILLYRIATLVSVGDEVSVKGEIGSYGGVNQIAQKGSEVTITKKHTCVAGSEATCTTAQKCTLCEAVMTEALGHNIGTDGICTVCGFDQNAAASQQELAKFEFGANGSAAHVDGNDLGTSKSYTEGSYTLTLENMSKVYGVAYDAKGNSAIKLGTSKVVGSFSFTVADDVDKVVIMVAQYKANTTKINVNGVDYTITTASNDGEYTAIEIDTTTTKTVNFTTVSGGVRAMIDSIAFWG